MSATSATGGPKPAAHLVATAGILAELAAQIEALGGRLCADPAVAANHLDALQQIDLIAQKTLYLAELLIADCPVAAVAAMGLDELKQRIGESLRQQAA